MLSVQHLERKRDELQKQYELLSEKIARLRRDSAFQAGTAVSFQLDKEIQGAEAERDRIWQQIEDLETSMVSERLYGALLRLNYTAQVRLFREFIEEQRIGAFLIHGSSECGQLWLLKRLMQGIPYRTVASPIEFHLRRRALRTDINALWRELGRHVGLPRPGATPDEIAKRVSARLQNQHVILVFHDIDCISEAYLDELIRDFWLLLTNTAQNALSPTSEFFLLMFLVDLDGCVSSWNVTFAEQFDSVWKPSVPIRLPIIDRLSDGVLVSWIENAVDALPPKFTRQVSHTVQTILENSDNGVPEQVLAQICSLCGYDWYEGEERWLKL